MAKLKEDILKNVGNDSSSNSTNDSTNTTSTTTSSDSSITNFSYIHGAGAIAVLALGVSIFIIPKYLKKTAAQPQNKSPEKISKIRRKML